tara:strand:- start:6043 stop:6744 length:702 start_codon:yes stop_codon:yes gene_type:complete
VVIAALARNKSVKRKQSKADISRDKVLAAAVQVFSEKGYAGATMREVARVAGLSAGSLYYYFSSKELMMEAVINVSINNVSKTVLNAIAVQPPSASYAEKIKVAIKAHLRGILSSGANAVISRYLWVQIPDDVKQKHFIAQSAYEEFWLNLLAAAQNAGEIRADLDARLTRTILLSAINSALDWYRPDGKSVDEIADIFFKLLEGGILTPGLAADDISSPQDRLRDDDSVIIK